MKAAGFLAVLLSCSLLGLGTAETLRLRAAFLQSLASQLGALRHELCSALRRVEDALRLLAAQSDEPAAAFFAACLKRFPAQELRTAWEAAAEECARFGLRQEERAMLSRLGGVIGRYDAERQNEALLHSAAWFEERARRAEEEKRRQYRLRAALGVSSGLMLAILLL